jgi:[ribosomal protein S5]-alanine N-acetyltransferase
MSHPAAEIVTERLVLRPLAAEHFDVFYDTLVADAHVMRFYHSYRTLTDRDQRRAKARKDFFDHFDEGARLHGYIAWGIWVGETFAGWCGITTAALPDPALGPEVQYMLGSGFQGRGYATEAARATVDDAFVRYGLGTIHAVCDTPNASSRRVLERLGFDFRGAVEVYGSSEMVLYALTAGVAAGLPAGLSAPPSRS